MRTPSQVNDAIDVRQALLHSSVIQQVQMHDITGQRLARLTPDRSLDRETALDQRLTQMPANKP
ncbi:hypothetical protein KAM380_058230 [Aeromonas caviae]|nr:hypothetical protein KAM380_058230 [Aeromonas caviae]